jgi:hypothetical protein
MQIDQTNLTPAAGIANYIHEGSPIVSGTDGDWSKKTDVMEVAATGSVYISDATYLRPGQEQEDKTTAEKINSDNGQSAESRRNQMAVIANTTSQEDLAKMQEDGYSLSDTDSRTIVTVTDKIKAALAKAGVDISKYGDTMSREELEEITGSDVVATQIAQELNRNDLPLTDDNLEDCQKAYEKAQEIDTPDDGAVRYLIQNELPPTIENIYKAEHSYTEAAQFTENRISDGDFAAIEEQVEKIIADAGLTVDDQTKADSRWLIQNSLPLTGENLVYVNQLRGLTTQDADEIIAAMGEAVAEGNRPMDGMLIEGYSLADQAQDAMDVVSQATDADLEYLIEKGQELTIANLKAAEANRAEGVGTLGITEVGEESTATEFGIAEAGQELSTAEEGIAAGQEATAGTLDESGLKLLTAKRQLEEIRLAMTTEANYALLKKGISIDTKPLEELVEDLKNQEKNYYRDLLEQSGIEAGEEKVSAFARTTEVLADLKGYPANILNPEHTDDTLNTLHESGRILKDTYTKANESYEALMTAPRKDLGDSIDKAFGNVDDILQDLNMDTTEANRRAVRILAYNEIDITVENISRMKAKDEEVQRVFSNMTPQVTMEMIRNNQNPLDMELSDLNRVAEEIKSQSSESDTERFSKYLWKLEQNQEITEEERDSYIGIYRLIAQVEKTDGAAIGALVNEGAELTMRNLLSAVRTGKKGGMDYRVDDDFAGAEGVAKNPRIDDQIMAAFQQNCLRDAMDEMTPQAAAKLTAQDWEDMTPEQLKEALQQAADEDHTDADLESSYLQEQLSELTEVLTAPEEVYAYLERSEQPNTVTNILAVEQLLRDPNQMFAALFQPKGASQTRLQQVAEMKELVLERFGEAIKTPEDLAEAQEALAETVEHAMDNMILENESVNSLDLRALRLATRQFTLCAQQTKEESYMIPMQTGDGVTGVSLKIIRGEKKKGFVDILFRGDTMGKVAASFEAKENGISGMIATDNEETRQLLADHAGMLAERLQEEGNEPVDLRVAYVPDLSLEHYSSSQEKRNAALLAKDDAEAQEPQKDPVQTTRLYHIAESFIGVMKEFE